ncbi:MAG: delta-60 repeat domain-containing protein [Luteimonas sp.]
MATPRTQSWLTACGRAFLLLCMLALLPHASSAQNADDGFNPSANGDVFALAVQADGKIIVGGNFTIIAGQTRNRVARLNPDGSLDTSFAATAVDGAVRAIAVQADGRIVIGGAFAQVGATLRNRIARLNADGSVERRIHA